MTDPDQDPTPDVTDLLGRLRGVEPAGELSVDAAMHSVRRRVVRHQTHVRAGAAVLAAAAAVALVVVPGSYLRGGDHHQSTFAGATPTGFQTTTPSSRPTAHPSASSSPAVVFPGGHSPSPGSKHHRESGPVVVAAATSYDELGCPTQWGSPLGEPWVPDAGPSDALVTPGATRLVLCGYPAALTGSRSLASSVSVRGGFAALADRLAQAAPGEFGRCPVDAQLTDYLIRVEHPAGTVGWVTVSGCGGASNGAFTSGLDLAPDVAAALAQQGTWGGAYPGDCAVTMARPGIEDALVPGGTDDPPSEAYICVTDPGAGQRGETLVTDPSLADLLSMLGSLSTSTSAPACSAPAGPTYLVNFVYAGGENVSVTVVPGCDTGVTNGALTAPATDDLVNLLSALTSSS